MANIMYPEERRDVELATLRSEIDALKKENEELKEENRNWIKMNDFVMAQLKKKQERPPIQPPQPPRNTGGAPGM